MSKSNIHSCETPSSLTSKISPQEPLSVSRTHLHRPERFLWSGGNTTLLTWIGNEQHLHPADIYTSDWNASGLHQAGRRAFPTTGPFPIIFKPQMERCRSIPCVRRPRGDRHGSQSSSSRQDEPFRIHVSILNPPSRESHSDCSEAAQCPKRQSDGERVQQSKRVKMLRPHSARRHPSPRVLAAESHILPSEPHQYVSSQKYRRTG